MTPENKRLTFCTFYGRPEGWDLEEEGYRMPCGCGAALSWGCRRVDGRTRASGWVWGWSCDSCGHWDPEALARGVPATPIPGGGLPVPPWPRTPEEDRS